MEKEEDPIDQFVQSYIDEFYRLMARLGIQEEEKLLFLKYVNDLSPYIQQGMEFMTVITLVDAFHYTIKLESKQKGKTRSANKPIGRTSDKKSLVDSNKLKNPSQPTPPKPDHQQKKC